MFARTKGTAWAGRRALMIYSFSYIVDQGRPVGPAVWRERPLPEFSQSETYLAMHYDSIS